MVFYQFLLLFLFLHFDQDLHIEFLIYLDGQNHTGLILDLEFQGFFFST